MCNNKIDWEFKGETLYAQHGREGRREWEQKFLKKPIEVIIQIFQTVKLDNLSNQTTSKLSLVYKFNKTKVQITKQWSTYNDK